MLPGPGTPYFGELTRRYESTREKNDSYKLRTSFDLTYEIADGLALKSGVGGRLSPEQPERFPAEGGERIR